MIQIFGTTKCKGTRAAQRFFADRALKVQVVDLKTKGLSAGELASVARAVGGVLALYDPEKDPTRRVAVPSETQLTALLLEHPTWLRTPIVRRGTAAAVGTAPEKWAELAAAEKAAG